MEAAVELLLLAVGFVMLMKGADWFVEGASRLADRFGIPQLVIGLTIVAMGTSLPEAAVSISAAVKGSAGITIGNVVGSNIMNVLVILGLTSVICAVPVQKSTVFYEIPFTILITVLLAVMGLMDCRINRREGVILWGLMIMYLLYLLMMAKRGNASNQKDVPAGKEDSAFKMFIVIIRMLVMIVTGIVLIVWGSDIVVSAASSLAEMFGMGERFIGLTIVALGTSLPELVTSVTAALRGKTDIAVGNIVGSNIFNILFVVGTTALITPVVYSSDFLVDSVAAAAAAVLLFLCVFSRKKLSRTGGILMLAGYGAYFAYLVG